VQAAPPHRLCRCARSNWRIAQAIAGLPAPPGKPKPPARLPSTAAAASPPLQHSLRLRIGPAACGSDPHSRHRDDWPAQAAVAARSTRESAPRRRHAAAAAPPGRPCFLDGCFDNIWFPGQIPPSVTITSGPLSGSGRLAEGPAEPPPKATIRTSSLSAARTNNQSLKNAYFYS